MTGYSTGANFERRIMTELAKDGYQTMRAAGSKGVADVIALKPGQVLLVQVKLTKPQLTPAERRNLRELARTCGALPIIAYRTRPWGPVGYRRLTGDGPKDWCDFVPDEVAAG